MSYPTLTGTTQICAGCGAPFALNDTRCCTTGDARMYHVGCNPRCTPAQTKGMTMQASDAVERAILDKVQPDDGTPYVEGFNYGLSVALDAAKAAFASSANAARDELARAKPPKGQAPTFYARLRELVEAEEYQKALDLMRTPIAAMPETAALLAAIEAKDAALEETRAMLKKWAVRDYFDPFIAKIDAALTAPAQRDEG